MQETIRKFKEILAKRDAYQHALGVLQYDSETAMPRAGAAGYAAAMGALSEEVYKLQTSDAFKGAVRELLSRKAELDEIVERSLRSAAIWDEVRDRLKTSALGLSGGQQQRLCIARALAVEPDILLMDESTSALDPISTAKIEDLIAELKQRYTVIMVTHNMQQAVRISDRTAFFLLGELVEYGATDQIFTMPSQKKTEDYISGRFG